MTSRLLPLLACLALACSGEDSPAASGLSGSSGQNGVCFVPAPPDAECRQDSDCGVSDSPGCEQVHCDTCVSWTCIHRPINQGQTCQLLATQCHGGGQGFCSGAACLVQGIEFKSCPFADPCLPSLCNPGTGQCEAKPEANGTPCGRRDGCFEGSTCQQGQCQGGELLDCTATGNPCVEGYCENGGYCSSRFRSGPCDDGNLCTTDDACDLMTSLCTGVAASLDCRALDQAAVVGACLPSTGQCGTVARPAGELCTLDDACRQGGQTDGYGLCLPDPTPNHLIWFESFHTGAKDWTIQGIWAVIPSVKVSQIDGVSVSSPSQESVPEPSRAGLVVALEDAYQNDPTQISVTKAESPPIDLSAEQGPVRLSFRRWQHDLGGANLQTLLVEVFDGTAWLTVASTPLGGLPSNSWQSETIDVSAAKNKAFRVRFRHAPQATDKTLGNAVVSLDEVELRSDCAP